MAEGNQNTVNNQHPEEVNKGGYAKYVYELNYDNDLKEHRKQGKIFVGWKYNEVVKKPSDYAPGTESPFGPINGDTTITSVWHTVNFVRTPTGSVPIEVSGDGADVTVTYYVNEEGGSKIIEGVDLLDYNEYSGIYTRVDGYNGNENKYTIIRFKKNYTGAERTVKLMLSFPEAKLMEDIVFKQGLPTPEPTENGGGTSGGGTGGE